MPRAIMKRSIFTRGMLSFVGGLLYIALPAAGASYAQQTVPPGNTNPERDERGVLVISDPATAPAGANEPIPVVPPGAIWVPNPNAISFAAQPSTGEKPPCSRTVTDNCTQTYEVGRRGGRHPAFDPPFCPDPFNALCPRPHGN